MSLVSWRGASRFAGYRVVVDRDELRVGDVSIPWNRIARLRERGPGIDVLADDRTRLARFGYQVEGVEELVAELLRRRPELLAMPDPAPPIGGVTIKPDHLEIAGGLRGPRSIPLGELSQPWLRLGAPGVLASRLEVSVAWPSGGADGRLKIDTTDPIRLWAALRRVLPGPAVPAV